MTRLRLRPWRRDDTVERSRDLLPYRDLAFDSRRVPASDLDYGLADKDDLKNYVLGDMPPESEVDSDSDLRAIAAAVGGLKADPD